MRLKRELLSDEKELAEHRMPIDLARNGIGKFAAPIINLACNAPLDRRARLCAGTKRDARRVLQIAAICGGQAARYRCV